jgi:uncharacterized membrane protein HdeD (DUF308 family)
MGMVEPKNNSFFFSSFFFFLLLPFFFSFFLSLFSLSSLFLVPLGPSLALRSIFQCFLKLVPCSSRGQLVQLVAGAIDVALLLVSAFGSGASERFAASKLVIDFSATWTCL